MLLGDGPHEAGLDEIVGITALIAPATGHNASRSRALGPVAAKGIRDPEHHQFGEGNAFNKQQSAVGAEDAQRAFDLAAPVERQKSANGLNEPQILVRGGGQKRCVPPPSRNDDEKRADKSRALEGASPGPSRNEKDLSLHA